MRADALAVELTGSGRGGVATVGVRGADALAVLQRCFAAARQDRPLQVGQVRYGQWIGPDANGPPETKASESVVVTASDNETIEVHCHGGRAAVAAILADLQTAGATCGTWSEWLRMQGKPTLEAEAECVLARTTTRRTAAIALAQCQGAMRRCVEDWLQGGPDPRSWPQIRAQIEELTERGKIGRHLVDPWKVVLAGAPIVGKSSLLNALVGYRRAITFDAPGTTRDVVAVETIFDGWPVQLSDTAGIRVSEDGIERQGVAYAERTIREADLVVWVSDARDSLPAPTIAAMEQRPSLLVRNKADLLEQDGAARMSAAQVQTRADEAIFTVARAADDTPPGGHGIANGPGLGLDELSRRIVASLVGRVPEPGAAVPLTSRQLDRLREARNAAGFADAEAPLRKLLDEPADPAAADELP